MATAKPPNGFWRRFEGISKCDRRTCWYHFSRPIRLSLRRRTEYSIKDKAIATQFKDYSNAGAPHILYISPAFVPRCDSEAFCSAKFADALSDAGAAVSIFACPLYGMQTVDVSPLWDRVRKLVVDFPVSSSIDPIQSLRMAARFKSLSYARWIGAALQEAQRIQSDRPFDVVYSRSLPMFGHIAGYWCAKYLGLPWVANVNDPWDWHLFPVRLVNKRRIPNVISNLWMKKTFRSADLVTYPSQRLHAYHEKISGIRHHSLVIPHVGTVPLRDAPPQQPSQTFSLVHAGKLGLSEATGRSAVPLLRGLRLFLQDFPEAAEITRLVFVGPSDGAMESLASELQLTAIVSSVGRVTYEQSLNFIRDASVCVLVEAEMPEGIFLPSKLVDYLSARKPVLALSPRVGVINDMAERFGILCVDTGDVEAVRRAIGSLYRDFRNHILHLRRPAQEQVSQFEPKNLAATFLTALRNLTQSKRIGSTTHSNYKIGTERTPDVLVK